MLMIKFCAIFDQAISLFSRLVFFLVYLNILEIFTFLNYFLEFPFIERNLI